MKKEMVLSTHLLQRATTRGSWTRHGYRTLVSAAIPMSVLGVERSQTNVKVLSRTPLAEVTALLKVE